MKPDTEFARYTDARSREAFAKEAAGSRTLAATHNCASKSGSRVQTFAFSSAKGFAKCQTWKRTKRRHGNAREPPMRCTIRPSGSNYLASRVFTRRSPITLIAGMSTAATKTKVERRLRGGGLPQDKCELIV